MLETLETPPVGRREDTVLVPYLSWWQGCLCTGYHWYGWVAECLLPQTRIVHLLPVNFQGRETLAARSSSHTELSCPCSFCRSEMTVRVRGAAGMTPFPVGFSEIQLGDATLPGVESADHDWMTGGHSSCCDLRASGGYWSLALLVSCGSVPVGYG